MRAKARGSRERGSRQAGEGARVNEGVQAVDRGKGDYYIDECGVMCVEEAIPLIVVFKRL